jgi:sucrose-6-phosphate hydrolase SacC (GH32 family)
LVDGQQSLTVFVDRTILEVFASGGLTYVPLPFIPKPEDRSVSVDVKGGKAKMTSLQVHKLKAIWEPETAGHRTLPKPGS